MKRRVMSLHSRIEELATPEEEFIAVPLSVILAMAKSIYDKTSAWHVNYHFEKLKTNPSSAYHAKELSAAKKARLEQIQWIADLLDVIPESLIDGGPLVTTEQAARKQSVTKWDDRRRRVARCLGLGLVFGKAKK